MKKFLLVFATVLSLSFMGCVHQNKVVKGKDGNYYILKYKPFHGYTATRVYMFKVDKKQDEPMKYIVSWCILQTNFCIDPPRYDEYNRLISSGVSPCEESRTHCYNRWFDSRDSAWNFYNRAAGPKYLWGYEEEITHVKIDSLKN